MSGIMVSPAEMNQRGQQTVEHGYTFESELNSLASNIQALMGVWTGDAAQKFDQSFQEINTTFAGFKEKIIELGNSISAGATTLDATEQENTDMANRLGNNIL